MTAVVNCEGLWKSYHVHRAIGVKSLLVGRGERQDTRFAREWALSDVSFSVRRGGAFGVVGPNGSGKTTLLSVLLGTIHADRGRVETGGRVAPLLDVGAGFHADLTGRENAFLYGSILGMCMSEIRERLDAIVDFSELADAVDRPLRTYSAGMIARLGFSIIINSSADILLIDEVLAVGDARFQEKCHRRLREFTRDGGALVIVSHNLAELASVCDEGICLELGRMVDAGPIDRVVSAYAERAAAGSAAKGAPA